jgi:hypothetical protein
LNQAAIASLGEIARNGRLVFDDTQSVLQVVESLHKKILTSQETNKVKEKAAATLGYMCLFEPIVLVEGEKKLDDLSKQVMQKLLDSSQAKQIELHMAIGEALVNCALGNRSDASLNPWVVDASSIDGETRNKLVK